MTLHTLAALTATTLAFPITTLATVYLEAPPLGQNNIRSLSDYLPISYEGQQPQCKKPNQCKVLASLSSKRLFIKRI